MPSNGTEDGSKKTLQEVTEEFTKQLLAHFEQNEYRYDARHVDRTAFWATFRTALQERSGLTRQAADAEAARFTADLLAEEIRRHRAQIQAELRQYDSRLSSLGAMADFLGKVGSYEFLTQIGGNVVGRNAGTIERSVQQLTADLEALQEIDVRLEGALDARPATSDAAPDVVDADYLMALASLFAPAADGPMQDVEARRSAIRAFYKKLDERIAAVQNASKAMNEASRSISGAVTGSALESYFLKHPDERMRGLEELNRRLEFVIGAVGQAAPPGFAWIVGLTQTVRDAIARAAGSQLLDDAKKKYGKDHLPGEVFAEFAKDPLLMAEALDIKLMRNVNSLLTAISAAGREMKGAWPFIEAGIRAAVQSWQQRRITLARQALAALAAPGRPHPSAESVKAKAAEILGEMKDSAKEEIEDALKSGETWGTVAKQYADAEFDPEWATSLPAVLVAPLVQQIVKLIPVEPAQIVTDDDLLGVLDGKQIAQAIPAKYRTTPEPTTDDAPRFHHAADSLADFVGRFPWTVLDSNALKDEEGGPGQENRSYVLLRCKGIKIWGYLVGRGKDDTARWEPRMVDPSENKHPWGERRITLDGYLEGNGTKVTGTWYVPTPGSLTHCHILVRDDGSPGEWLPDIARTRLGRAGEIFAEAGLGTIELTPDRA